VRIQIALNLPRDGSTVPVVRHLCGLALQEMGATDDCVTDVQLVLSEACANVLTHGNNGDEYEVEVDIDDDACRVRVVDSGHGIHHDTAVLDVRDDGDPLREDGRGIPLMSALVNTLDFQERADRGTVVYLEKRLERAR
jgi:serine/threonine-protein kinase RsbW